MKKLPHVELDELIDHIDDNNWAEWTCWVTWKDGRTERGYIQSDGHEHSIESFVADPEA